MISYGALDNGQLMEAYGFYDEQNEMDGVWFTRRELDESARALLGDVKFDQAVGLWGGEAEAKEEYGVFRGGEEEELMMYLRRICLGDCHCYMPSSAHLAFAFTQDDHRLILPADGNRPVFCYPLPSIMHLLFTAFAPTACLPCLSPPDAALFLSSLISSS